MTSPSTPHSEPIYDGNGEVAGEEYMSTSRNDAFDELLSAMKRARDDLYNGFEPDNQSRAYHAAVEAVRKAGLARASFHSETVAPHSATVPTLRIQECLDAARAVADANSNSPCYDSLFADQLSELRIALSGLLATADSRNQRECESKQSTGSADRT